MRKFRATAVAAVEMPDINTFAVVLAEHEHEDGLRLELQCSLSQPDEQDIELGMDSYCLCTESCGAAYGCVDGWSVDNQKVEIRLTPLGQKQLHVSDGFLIDIPVGTEEVVRAGMRRVLAYPDQSSAHHLEKKPARSAKSPQSRK